MSNTVIRVENLGKSYRLRHQTEERYLALRDVIAKAARSFGQRMLGREGGRSESEEEFWALRNVSFELKQGEVLGVIGRNGAGKSTLLKVLSRITEPTEGRVHIQGRIASLLEVGTGFHPELTGRENVFLNGAILGMTRLEIKRKFDEIASFAEIDQFLDTPVKRYSSGMYVRLAFAVAAHLEPDILIVDEVLAVGDAAFQKKCIGKMKDVSFEGGRTVLFVSHNLHAIRQLCHKAALFEEGHLQTIGPVTEVIGQYERVIGRNVAKRTLDVPLEIRDICYVVAATVESRDGVAIGAIPVGQIWQVRLHIRIARSMERFVAAIGFVRIGGEPVQTVWTSPMPIVPGDYEVMFAQDRVILAAGSYDIFAGLSNNERTIQQIECGQIEIVSEGAKGYFQLIFGVGAVLNSMSISTRRLND